MKRNKKVSRRRFLGTTTAAAAGIIISASNTIKGMGNGRMDKNNIGSTDADNPVSISTSRLRFSMSPANGTYQITDHLTKTVWNSNPFQTCFGKALFSVEGKSRPVILSQCNLRKKGNSLIATFHPFASQPSAGLRITIQPGLTASSLIFSYEADTSLTLESISLLNNALWTTDAEKGYVVIPDRDGLLIPADSGLSYSQSFPTYGYEGCHIAMMGIVKNNATALITWNDPYTIIEINSQQPKTVLGCFTSNSFYICRHE